MIIAGLDISKRSTGWAFGEPGGRAELGSKSFASAQSDGALDQTFREWLGAFLVNREITHLAAESTYVPRQSIKWGHGKPGLGGPPLNAATLRCLFGLRFAAEGTAHLCGVVFEEIPIGKISKAFTGTTRHGGRERKKAITIEYARLRGYDITSDDEADALSVWEYACGIWAPAHARNVSGSLFGGVRG